MNIKLLTLTTLLLLSCKSDPILKEITVTDTKYISIPDSLLINCDYPPPPILDQYNKLSYQDKERSLVDIYLKGLEYNQICNTRLSKAREYQVEMLRLYEEDNNDIQDTKTNTE